jgi:voltage-gated potassium channel
LVSTTLLSIVLIIFSSIAILIIESDPNSNISTAEDAIWWTFCTITTVGYGDKYPVTTEGRIIAIILMTYGVALLGVITGFVTAFFISPENK